MFCVETCVCVYVCVEIGVYVVNDKGCGTQVRGSRVEGQKSMMEGKTGEYCVYVCEGLWLGVEGQMGTPMRMLGIDPPPPPQQQRRRAGMFVQVCCVT